MRPPSGKRGVSCSFCDKSVQSDGADIIGFQLHKDCADSLAAVLGKVNDLFQLKKAQSRQPTLQLTA
jgi:hypothetical protein